MAGVRVVVLGAGIAGHTAGTLLRKWLPKEHEVVVVSPRPDYNWVPSNIWVGVGLMKPKQVLVSLPPIYARNGIGFRQAAAVSIHPEGNAESEKPFVVLEHTGDRAGQKENLTYDFLINATGPKLNFEATPGLGPKHHSLSVCTPYHAEESSKALDEKVERMKRGEKQRFVIGTGHGGATCQGAAFEYIVNLEFELRARGVREKADITYLTNEYDVGDFGMGGIHLRYGGYVTPSRIFTESLFAERGIDWVTRSHVQKVEPGRIQVENLAGEERELTFDMAMLIPPFTGVGIKAFDKAGADITPTLFAPSGFMKVDADYTPKPYQDWKASDWPRTYQTRYPNVFAAGIAFAPPHAIPEPHKNPKGTNITPAPPRTGMPSGTIARAVAESIVDLIKGAPKPTHTASMAEMGAACVASAGSNPFTGAAASITVFPIIPDFEKFPEYGRDLDSTFGEIGLAGHWTKIALHHMFLHKARMRPLWSLIPE